MTTLEQGRLPDYVEGFIYDDSFGEPDGKYVRVGQIMHVWKEGNFFTVITPSQILRLFADQEDKQ